MVKTPTLNLPTTPPREDTLTQRKFDKGVIDIVDESDLPEGALKQADNWWLEEAGTPSLRPGVGWYGAEVPNGEPIEGGGFFTTSTFASHIVVVAGGVIYRSTDEGANWEACTGATFTTGHAVGVEQANNYLYLFNGWDYMVRYDGTTTLVTYTSISAPTGNTPTATGLAGTAIYTYRYRVAAVNEVGSSIASTAVTKTVDRERSAFDDSNYLTFTWSAVTGAKFYDIYVGQTAGEEAFIARIEGQASVTYVDRLNAPEQTQILAPTTNSTQGLRVGDVALIGSRLYATQDRDNPFRVWIGAGGRLIGQFGTGGIDSTYVDLQKGSQYRPIISRDFKDRTGQPVATIWCDSNDGRGCVWQGSLDSLASGADVILIPNFYKLPGSRGTNAPFSVVNVLNDFVYYNSQAIYNIGSRADFLNLLSTDETSGNIRNSVRSINPAASNQIAAYYYEAKIYISVPYNSDENNSTIIFDTERKAWLPRAFTIGFSRFFQYTDSSAGRHLLAWKPGDNRLSEISADIKGDYGEAFRADLITGLNHVNPRDRFQFMWCTEGEVEFAEPQGQIDIELSAITRESGYKPVATRSIIPTTSMSQWTNSMWTTHVWTEISDSGGGFAETSMKRYFRVQKDINAYQYRITVEDINGQCTIRTLQIKGTPTQGGKPRLWELQVTSQT